MRPELRVVRVLDGVRLTLLTALLGVGIGTGLGVGFGTATGGPVFCLD